MPRWRSRPTSGKLSLPRFVYDPIDWVESSLSPKNIWTSDLPVPPAGVLDIAHYQPFVDQVMAYLDRIHDFLTEQTPWGVLNFYIPGVLGLIEDPSSFFIEGY